MDSIADMSATEAWGPTRSKTISWYGIEAVQAHQAGLSGIDFIRGIAEGRFPPPPIACVFGFELAEVAHGEIVVRCTPDESMLNPLGLVHGGVLCTVMDTAMGIAVQTTVPAGTGYASIELKVSFLKPLPYDGRPFEVRGKALQVGRRVAFSEAHAYGPNGTLVGHATSSLAAFG